MEYNSLEIAKTLTILEFDIFKKVIPNEFLIKIGWQQEHNKNFNSPNINKLIHRFNEVNIFLI